MQIFGFLGSLLGYALWAAFYVFHNFGLAIIVFTIVIKAVLFPFSVKQQKSMAGNARMAKKQKELQEKYGNNRQLYQEELNKLYEKKLSTDYFIDFFAEAAEAAEKRGVPLYCGEYGVIDRARPEDALIWYRLIHQAFEHYGIGRAAWSYRQMDFGLSDERMDAVRPELILNL